jgi:hypothetical protein
MFTTNFITNFIYSDYEERKRLIQDEGLISSRCEIKDHPKMIKNYNFDLDLLRSKLYENSIFNEILDKNLIFDILKSIRYVYHNTFKNIVLLFDNQLIICFTNDSKITDDTYILELNDESYSSLSTFHNTENKHFKGLYNMRKL